MLPIELIFDIANFFFLIGTFLLIISIIRNRAIPKGLDPIGSLLTLVAMLFITFNYIQMEIWRSVAFSIPTIAFWILASFFGLQSKIRGWLERRKGEQEVYKILGYKNRKEAVKGIRQIQEAEEIIKEIIKLIPSELIFTDEDTEVHCGRCGMPIDICMCKNKEDSERLERESRG